MYGVRAVLLYECDVQNTRAGSCTCCTTAVRRCTTLYAAVRTVSAVRAVRPLYGTVPLYGRVQSASTASQRSRHAGWHPSGTAAHPSKGTWPFQNLPCVHSWRLLRCVRAVTLDTFRLRTRTQSKVATRNSQPQGGAALSAGRRGARSALALGQWLRRILAGSASTGPRSSSAERSCRCARVAAALPFKWARLQNGCPCVSRLLLNVLAAILHDTSCHCDGMMVHGHVIGRTGELRFAAMARHQAWPLAVPRGRRGRAHHAARTRHVLLAGAAVTRALSLTALQRLRAATVLITEMWVWLSKQREEVPVLCRSCESRVGHCSSAALDHGMGCAPSISKKTVLKY